MAENFFNIKNVLKTLGICDVNAGITTGTDWLDSKNEFIESYSPIDGLLIAKTKQPDKKNFEKVIVTAQTAFKIWRKVPAPKRGEIIRQIGMELRNKKESLAILISFESESKKLDQVECLPWKIFLKQLWAHEII